MKMAELDKFNFQNNHLKETIQGIIKELRHREIYITHYDDEGEETKVKDLEEPREIFNVLEILFYAQVTEVGEELEDQIEDWCNIVSGKGVSYIQAKIGSIGHKGEETLSVVFIDKEF